MTNINEVYTGSSLKATDLDGRHWPLTIKTVGVQAYDDSKKLIITFDETKRSFIVNKTNANTISDMFGPETDDWIGRKITLFPSQTDFQGRQVPCIRVALPDMEVKNEQPKDNIPF